MKKNKHIVPQNTFTDFLLYTTPNGEKKVEIFLHDETVWLTQKKMADLFGVGIPAINKHIKNIFESEELLEDSVISKMEITAEDGKTYSTKFYNLDDILLNMRDWVKKLDAFLQFNEKEILQDSGKVSHEVAVALAESVWEKYRAVQDRLYESDFDREVKKLLEAKKEE